MHIFHPMGECYSIHPMGVKAIMFELHLTCLLSYNPGGLGRPRNGQTVSSLSRWMAARWLRSCQAEAMCPPSRALIGGQLRLATWRQQPRGLCDPD